MRKHIATSRGNYYYSFRPMFHGRKIIDKVIAKENLMLLKDILDREKLTFLLSFGTLLGAVREHDFISHDEDIDLIMMKSDMNAFLALLFLLRDNGFDVVRYEPRGFLSIMRKGEYIDFYFYDEYKNDNRFLYCARDLYFKEELTETSDIIFHGKNFKAPKDVVKYLRFNYGENWATPVAMVDYEISLFTKIKYSISQYVKAILPYSIVLRIQESSDREFIDKWLRKAETFK